MASPQLLPFSLLFICSIVIKTAKQLCLYVPTRCMVYSIYIGDSFPFVLNIITIIIVINQKHRGTVQQVTQSTRRTAHTPLRSLRILYSKCTHAPHTCVMHEKQHIYTNTLQSSDFVVQRMQAHKRNHTRYIYYLYSTLYRRSE